MTGKRVLGAKRYRSLESTCTQEPSEFGHCQGATMRARYDARRSGNVARMKGERERKFGESKEKRLAGAPVPDLRSTRERHGKRARV